MEENVKINDMVEVENAVNEDEIVDVAPQEDSLSGLTEGQRRRRNIFDKITTGLLVALMASPVAILAYIFAWFIININSR
jgi:hypothetical protein